MSKKDTSPESMISSVATNHPAENQSLPSISNIEIEAIDIFEHNQPRALLYPHASYPVAQASIPQVQLHTSSGSTSDPLEAMQVDSNTTSTQFNPLASSLSRDILLSYAQRDYMMTFKPGPARPTPLPIHSSPQQHTLDKGGNLLALLTILKTFHPAHLPTLLLLGCTYYTSGDLISSLNINQEILKIDPNYVEAMCNIGCIMKSLDKREAAFDWWWKALRLHPMYWDVVDNLLSLILETPASYDPMVYRQALDVCDFVLSNLVDKNGRLLTRMPYEQLSRVQNICCTRANLFKMSEGQYIEKALDSYCHAMDLALKPQPALETDQYSFRDLITATCIVGLHLMEERVVSTRIIHMLGLEQEIDLQRPGFSILHTVHELGDHLIALFHEEQLDNLPLLILDPEQVEHLPFWLFTTSHGVLPANCIRESSSTDLKLIQEDARKITNKVTSKTILMIARHFQDILSDSSVHRSFQSYRISTSLVLLLYYLALALSPSATVYNNIGALLSTVSSSVIRTIDSQKKVITTEHLTTILYKRGLQLDPTHAHLLTNLGSALKNEGDVSSAMQLYTKALETNPELDVALVNMGNLLRDVDRPWEAVTYYRRALSIKPLPEASCGLASALYAICDWQERGWLENELPLIQNSPAKREGMHRGWIGDLVTSCELQLQIAHSQNVGFTQRTYTLQSWLDKIQSVYDQTLSKDLRKQWQDRLRLFYTDFDRKQHRVNEGSFLVRLVEWLSRGLQWRWYIDTYGSIVRSESDQPQKACMHHDKFYRPDIPSAGHFPVPPILPFDCFSFPLDPRIIRLISHRTALRISYKTLIQPWLPKHVYPPPPPPFQGRLNIGYVSYDFGDHPLAHLIQSIFGYHDKDKFNVYAYATGPDDGSSYRRKIVRESQFFLDVSSWKTDAIVNQIIKDKIHILINLGGFTRGSRNEIFAARPCPIQILLMGFPGPLNAGWCDYVVGDLISCPRDTLFGPPKLGRPAQRNVDLHISGTPDPESLSSNWVHTEKIIYMPDTLMITDHKQSFRDNPDLTFAEFEKKRSEIRQKIFPDLSPDVFIFANFSRIDPVTLSAWLLILERVPHSILWLLRFPAAGEEHVLRTAEAWANDEVASRIHFTDVSSKEEHIRRASVADIFLDTFECNAHTVAADVLWSGTPILTWPKDPYKMCSRIGASLAYATGFGERMVVHTIEEYKERAIFLANQAESGQEEHTDNELKTLRRNLYVNRLNMPLFDTKRWTRNFEKACWKAWKRWVAGTELSDTSEPFILIKDGG